MAQIKTYPLIRQLRADASTHIQHFRKGRRVRSGRGLAFWFLPDGASIAEIPMDDRELPFLLKGQSADYQDLTVQGTIFWRAADPVGLGERIDFTVDLDVGIHIGQPIDQVNNVLIARVRQFTNAYLKQQGVRDLLEAGTAPLQEAVVADFANDTALTDMGLELVGVSIASIAPSSELERALQAPTFESLQQQADEATFARRALAVEKERAIAENELHNKIELATRQKDLIAREDENARSEAEAQAAAMKIDANAEADRIRVVEQAQADMERARMDVYANLQPTVLLAMAAQEFAGKLERIDNLTVTPDMLAGLMTQIRGVFDTAPQTKEVQQ